MHDTCAWVMVCDLERHLAAGIELVGHPVVCAEQTSVWQTGRSKSPSCFPSSSHECLDANRPQLRCQH
jgi:hypothetical protein